MSSKKDEAQKSNKKNSLLVAIRIRGTVGLKPKIKYTLQSLRLLKRYNAILLRDDSEVVGMLRIAKDFITWGEIDEENIELIRAMTSGDTTSPVTNKIEFRRGDNTVIATITYTAPGVRSTVITP